MGGGEGGPGSVVQLPAYSQLKCTGIIHEAFAPDWAENLIGKGKGPVENLPPAAKQLRSICSVLQPWRVHTCVKLFCETRLPPAQIVITKWK